MKKFPLMRRHSFLQLRNMGYLLVVVTISLVHLQEENSHTQDHQQVILHIQDNKWGVAIILDLLWGIPNILFHRMVIPSLNLISSGLKHQQAPQAVWEVLQEAWAAPQVVWEAPQVVWEAPQGVWVEDTKLLQAIIHHK